MSPDINYWAVLVAAVVNMVVGFMWFGPLFGKTWIKLAGLNYEHLAEGAKKGMGKKYFIAFVGSFLIAFTLDHGLIFGNSYLGMSGALAGLQGAFWYWLGFFVPVTSASYLWEGKPFKLWLLNAGYYLVVLIIMGTILASWV